MWRMGRFDEEVGLSSAYSQSTLFWAELGALPTTWMVTQSMTRSKLTEMVVLSLLSALPHPSDMITHLSVTVAHMGTNA